MKILLTNDDGYLSSGINCLFDVLKENNDICLIGPVNEKSGFSQAFTVYGENTVEKIKDKKYAFDGTPVDCVKYGMLKFGKFDLIISGINRGSNLGSDIYYSGTVGAVRHGYISGISGISVSKKTTSNKYKAFINEAKIIGKIVNIMEKNSEQNKMAVNDNFLININFPSEYDKIVGIKECALGKRIYIDNMNEKELLNNKAKITFMSNVIEESSEENSDVFAVKNNYISVTNIGIFNVNEKYITNLIIKNIKDKISNKII